MKSTKNLLITSVALTIALFTSIQVAAMSTAEELMAKGVNPYLTPSQKKLIIWKVGNIKELLPCDSKKDLCKYQHKLLQKLETIFSYDKRPYTDEELYDIIEGRTEL